MAREFFSICINVVDVADSLELDGAALAELFNSMRRAGPIKPEVLVEFAQTLDEDGRNLVTELFDALADDEAEEP